MINMNKKIKIFFFIIIMSLFTKNVYGNYDRLDYDFNFNDLDGSQLELSDYKNKVIIVFRVITSPKYNQVMIGNVIIDVANPINRTAHKFPKP